MENEENDSEAMSDVDEFLNNMAREGNSPTASKWNNWKATKGLTAAVRIAEM